MPLSRTCVLALVAAALASAQSNDLSAINQYCTSCHNTKAKIGNLALDDKLDIAKHPAEWESVLRKLRARMMPPIGLPRPDDRSYNALIATLSTTLDRAAALHPNPGRTDTFRRLNRT